MLNVLSRNRVTSAERKKLGKFIILFEKNDFFLPTCLCVLARRRARERELFVPIQCLPHYMGRLLVWRLQRLGKLLRRCTL